MLLPLLPAQREATLVELRRDAEASRSSALDALRAVTDRPEGAVPDISDEVVNRADLLRALLTLPARQRATVVLRYLEGMSERETAAVMRCSEGTVKSQTARALNTLGGCLKHKELPR